MSSVACLVVPLEVSHSKFKELISARFDDIFFFLHHLTLTYTLVASTAAVHENLSGGLQT